MNSYWRSISTAPLIPNLGTRWRSVANFRPRPFYLRKKNPSTHWIKGLSGPQIWSGRFWRGQYFLALPALKPGPSSPLLVAIPTDLPNSRNFGLSNAMKNVLRDGSIHRDWQPTNASNIEYFHKIWWINVIGDLTTCYRVLCAVKQFPNFHSTRRFLSSSQQLSTVPWISLINPVHILTPCFLNANFDIILLPMPRFRSALSFQGLRTKHWMKHGVFKKNTCIIIPSYCYTISYSSRIVNL
jgi:hypothetical protein